MSADGNWLKADKRTDLYAVKQSDLCERISRLDLERERREGSRTAIVSLSSLHLWLVRLSSSKFNETCDGLTSWTSTSTFPSMFCLPFLRSSMLCRRPPSLDSLDLPTRSSSSRVSVVRRASCGLVASSTLSRDVCDESGWGVGRPFLRLERISGEDACATGRTELTDDDEPIPFTEPLDDEDANEH